MNSGTLSGVTLSPSSTAVVPAGNGPLVANGLTNNGTIYVQGKPGVPGGMLFDGSQTLSGSGSIVLALQGTDTSWTLLQTNDTLTQAAGHTITAGQVLQRHYCQPGTGERQRARPDTGRFPRIRA